MGGVRKASSCERRGGRGKGRKEAQTNLDHGVSALEELNEPRDDSTLDNSLDRRVLLLGEQPIRNKK